MTLFNLKGKTAIVTGGASGIGKAISEVFSMCGAKVHILEVQVDSALLVVAQINRNGGRSFAHRCNVADQEEVHKVVQKIAANDGIDILINNAGIAHIGNVENTRESDFDKVYQVNVKGVYNCMRAVIPFMKEKGGVVINMTSVAASVGIKDRFAYSMSKGAALSMMYSVAKDYLDYGIRCNSISPARIHTPFVDGYIAEHFSGNEEEAFERLSKTQPIGRMGTPEEVANLALYLCSDEASFITGTDFPIDGGFIKLNG